MAWFGIDRCLIGARVGFEAEESEDHMIEVTELAKEKIRESLKDSRGNFPIRILVLGG